MLKPEFTGQFKRDYKLAVKRGCDQKKMETVISMLCNEGALPESYRDYALTNSRETIKICGSVTFSQIGWLVYKIVNERLILEADTDRNPQRFIFDRGAAVLTAAPLL